MIVALVIVLFIALILFANISVNITTVRKYGHEIKLKFAGVTVFKLTVFIYLIHYIPRIIILRRGKFKKIELFKRKLKKEKKKAKKRNIPIIRLLKRIKVKQFDLKLAIASGDAAQTAIVSSLISIALDCLPFDKKRINVTPLYGKYGFGLTVKCIIAFKLAHIIKELIFRGGEKNASHRKHFANNHV